MAALLVIDRLGRRKLMLIGSYGYIVSLTAVAWAYYTYAEPFKLAQGRDRQAISPCANRSASPDGHRQREWCSGDSSSSWLRMPLAKVR